MEENTGMEGRDSVRKAEGKRRMASGGCRKRYNDNTEEKA